MIDNNTIAMLGYIRGSFKKCGLKKGEFAEKFGIHSSTLSRMLKCKPEYIKNVSLITRMHRYMKKASERVAKLPVN